MRLSDYKYKLKQIGFQIDSVKRSSTPEIEDTAERLRELREYHSRTYLVPKLNELEAEQRQVKRLIAIEKKRLDAKKGFPTAALEWFERFKKDHKGYRIRWAAGDWIIVSNPCWHVAHSTSPAFCA